MYFTPLTIYHYGLAFLENPRDGAPSEAQKGGAAYRRRSFCNVTREADVMQFRHRGRVSHEFFNLSVVYLTMLLVAEANVEC